ncbi:MAG TPA: DUF192 domain-containing protein [Gaiellaceae bacterium]|nr:DUF192 domain-containing protein [Gaiellaceae bacterium]
MVVDQDGRVVCERCLIADTPVARLKGLLGRKELPADEGVLLRPTSAVHTSFMRFSIDAVFLDGELGVVDVVEGLRPWRAAVRRHARSVLELAAGEGTRRALAPGKRLILVDEGRPPPPRAA